MLSTRTLVMAAMLPASSSSSAAVVVGGSRRLVDIGANLTDPVFTGVYRGKTRHESDFDAVLGRAWTAGLGAILVTAGTLQEARTALELARKDERLYCTVGVHPTRAGEFEDTSVAATPEAYVDLLREVIAEGKSKVAAIGECGLDADRTQFCSFETQLLHFERHFALAEESGLPLFLHSRSCGPQFHDVVSRHRDRFKHGVVHSFTGSAEEAADLVGMGLHIGINGCSLKTPENLAVVESIPLEWLMLETDAPWCGIKASHAGKKHVATDFPAVKKPERWEAGMCVKDRCEPCHIVQVAEVVAAVKGVSVDELAVATTANASKVFGMSLLSMT